MPEGLQILTIVLPIVTVTVFLVFLIVSFCTNSENRKFYKRTYNAIVSGEYVLADDSTSHGTRMKYFVPPQYVNEHWRCRDQVILFYEKGNITFKLDSQELTHTLLDIDQVIHIFTTNIYFAGRLSRSWNTFYV